MMCGHAKELIAASWTGELDATEESKLRHHLDTCAECGADMARLSSMWERMADMPAPEPSLALTERWRSTLESLSTTTRARQNSWKFTLGALTPQRPVWQAVAALLCVGIGLGIGVSIRSDGSKSEISQLREEVANTREMVALSLLRQQSASERLRGVDYSVHMPTMEPEVLQALIQAVSHDPNVNVRLAAIDALSKSSGNAQVRQSMATALGQQDSPMVQAALIDYLVDARDHGAMNTIRDLESRPDLNPAIRQRAGEAMRQLTQYK